MRYALTDTIADLLGHPVTERNQNAIVRCPFHEDRMPSLSIDLDRGFWICFGCDARGNLTMLAERLGKVVNDGDIALKVYEGSRNAIYEEPKDFAPLAKELRTNLYATKPNTVVEFITKRNLKPGVIKHFGLGWTGNRISFPYYDDEEVIGIKYRDAKGRKSSETGTRRGIYNVNDVRFKPYVILCEGESDTLAVWSALTGNPTYATVGVGGVPGVSASKTTWELWSLDLLWAKTVFVAFDNDEAGDRGAEGLLSVLGDRGIRIRPINGKDMTDHLLNGGTIDDFKELGRIAHQPEPS